jgi:hypothetical protein
MRARIIGVTVCCALVVVGCGSKATQTQTQAHIQKGEYDPPGPKGPYPISVRYDEARKVSITIAGQVTKPRMSSHCFTDGPCVDYLDPRHRTDLGDPVAVPTGSLVEVRTKARAAKVSISALGYRRGAAVAARRMDRLGRRWQGRLPSGLTGRDFLIVRTRYIAIKDFHESGGVIPFLIPVRVS